MGNFVDHVIAEQKRIDCWVDFITVIVLQCDLLMINLMLNFILIF